VLSLTGVVGYMAHKMYSFAKTYQIHILNEIFMFNTG
jgi:hypothetical protein